MEKKKSLFAIILVMVLSAFLTVSAINDIPTVKKFRTNAKTVSVPSKLSRKSSLPDLRRMPVSNAATTLYGIVNAKGYLGYCSFNAAAVPNFQMLFTHENINPTGSAIYVDGKLYVNYWENQEGVYVAKQYVFDVASGTLEDTRDVLVTSCATALAYDRTTDRVYGQFYDETMADYYWGVLDLGDGDVHSIANMDAMEQVYALAASPEGEIYGIDKFGKLVKINKETGHFSETIGETGITPKYIQSATFGADGNLYWAASTESGYNGLYKVNTSTAEATMVTQYADGRQIIALTPGDIAPADNAPKKVENMEFDFKEGALFGNVSFTLPTETEDGTKLTGKLTAYLDVDFVNYKAEGLPGEKVTIQVFAKAEDQLKFSAYTESNGVRSQRLNVYKWIGKDRPVLPADPVLTAVDDNGNVKLDWQAPVEGVHGGYVNPAEITYDIIRYPEAKYAAQNITATSFSEKVEMTKSRRLAYAVIPKYGSKIGKASYSNDYQINVTAEAPVAYDFSYGSADFDYFTVIDNNSDGYTWKNENRAELDGNPNGANDDWLISPSIRFKSDRMYYVTYKYWIQNGIMYPQVFEVKAGNGNTAADMTQTIVEPKTEKGEIDVEKSLTANFFAPSDGIYNIGIHNTSTKGGKMRVYSLSVNEGPLLTAPQMPTDLSVEAAEEGELKATVSLKAPTHAINGNPLVSLSKIEVLRANSMGKYSVVKTFESPAPGSDLSFEDTGVKTGDMKYKAVAYNANGDAGLYSAEASAYCGEDTPGAPTNVSITMTDNLNAHISWDAPTVGENGHYINPDNVTYTVYDVDDYLYGWDAQEEDLEETECDVEYDEDENQQFDYTYIIIPKNDVGEGSPALTKTIVFGNPYPLPFYEGFDNGYQDKLWKKTAQTWDDENGGWMTASDAGYGSTPGCLVYRGSYNNSQSLISGKISMADANQPVLTFRVRCDGANDGTKLTVKVADEYAGEYTPIYTLDCHANSSSKEWQRIQIPLADYTGKPYIHIAFEGSTGKAESLLLVDEISVKELPEHDLAINEAIEASPSFVKVGESTSKISVTVENEGTKDVSGSDYTVDFYKGNEKIGTVNGADVKSLGKTTLSYTYTPTVEDAGTVAIKAVVNYAADENTDNNESNTVNVKVGKASLPEVNDLKADKSDNGVSLSWTAPDVNVEGMRVTDGFEDYEPFAVSDFGDWTTRDVDGQETCTVGEYQYDHMGEPKAYQVFNPSMTSPKLTYDDWKPYSGDQMLVCFSTENPTNDDWLISPLLSGKKQNISFMAKTVDATYGKEKIEIWYSTTGTDAADFVLLTDKPYEVPATWTECVYTLPEGTKYFAIRCVSSVTFALFIDDISFEKKMAEGLSISGYNVYRNGKLIDSVQADETLYYDSKGKDGDKYYVTTIYNMGESAGSNVVIVGASGINGIEAPKGTNGATVYEINGQRANSLRKDGVYIVNGKKVVMKR